MQSNKSFTIQKAEINGNGYSPKKGTIVFEEYGDDFKIVNPNRTLDTKYSDDILWGLFNNIKKSSGRYDASPSNNKITFHFFDNFYKTERELWKNLQIQERLYRNRKKYIGKTQEEITNEELLRGFKISGIYAGYSHFSPLWIKAFIEEFKIDSIYDMTGGWGQRMLGAHNLDLYIYNDIWTESALHAFEQKMYFGMDNVEIYNNDSAKFYMKYDVDAIFTCPPYNNKEIYDENSKFKNIDDYLNWWKESLQHSINNSIKYIAYVIDNNNALNLQKITEQFGFKLLRIQSIGRNKKSHFTKNKKENENMYIFKRY